MRVLLDTNVFLKWMQGSALPGPVERLLMKSDTHCLISIVTGWEIVMKPRLGRSASDVESAIAEMGATLLPLRFKHLNELSELPIHEDHRDPFDRMLIAQALAEEVPIITSDMRFAAYPHLRVLWD